MARIAERALVVAVVVAAAVLVLAVLVTVWVVRLPSMDPVPIPSVRQG